MDLDKLTIKQLTSKLLTYGITLPGKTLKKDYVNALKDAHKGDVQVMSGADVAEVVIETAVAIGRAQASAEFGAILHPMKLIAELDSVRKLIIVQFNDIESTQQNPYEICENFAFELSTGTSNAYNFKGVFLPILRQDSSGWLHKDGGLNCWRNIQTYFTDKYKVIKMTNECREEMDAVFKEFLPRFGSWKQIQISAALAKADDLWQQTRFFRDLRNFVLTHNYCTFKPMSDSLEKLKEITQTATKRGVLELLGAEKVDFKWSRVDIQLYQEYIKEKRNKDTLLSLGPEFMDRVKRASSEKPVIKYENTFFYKRENQLPDFNHVFQPFVKNSQIDYQQVNTWLRDHNALCANIDDEYQKEAMKKDKKSVTDAVILKSPDADPTKIFGWRRCFDT